MTRIRAKSVHAGLQPAGGARPLSILLAALAVTLLSAALYPASAKDAPVPLAPIDSVLSDTLQLHGRVVYVDFWASWCPPCRHSFPWMKDLNQAYGERGLQVVTINLDKDHAAAEKFLAEIDADLPVVFDSAGTLAKRYHVEAMPTSFLYGRDGVLRNSYEGFRAADTTAVDSLIEALLKEEVKP